MLLVLWLAACGRQDGSLREDSPPEQGKSRPSAADAGEAASERDELAASAASEPDAGARSADRGGHVPGDADASGRRLDDAANGPSDAGPVLPSPQAARDASSDGARDASSEDLRDADSATVPNRSLAGDASSAWRDAPSGPVAAPREVCSRVWDTETTVPGTADAEFRSLAIDSAGNFVMVGNLYESRDFGTGRLRAPPATERGDPRTATLLLKLDSACRPLWAKALHPLDGATARQPLQVGCDAAGNIVVVTTSSTYESFSRFASFTSSTVEIASFTPDGVERYVHLYSLGVDPLPNTSSISANGTVLLSSQVDPAAQAQPDFGEGPIEVDGSRLNLNALFTADGTFVRSDLVGVSVRLELTQALGPMDEIVVASPSAPAPVAFYGAELGWRPSLAKVDANGNPIWQHELRRPEAHEPLGTMYSMAMASDGTIALSDRHDPLNVNVPGSLTLSSYHPNGSLRWQIPLRSEVRLAQIEQLAFGPSSGSLAMRGRLPATLHIGQGELPFEPPEQWAEARFLALLDRAGIVRWGKLLDRGHSASAIAVGPDDEVVVVGAYGDMRSVKQYVRKYAP